LLPRIYFCSFQFDIGRQKQEADATDDAHQSDRPKFEPGNAMHRLALRHERGDGQE
jgi:hypothetical protein